MPLCMESSQWSYREQPVLAVPLGLLGAVLGREVNTAKLRVRASGFMEPVGNALEIGAAIPPGIAEERCWGASSSSWILQEGRALPGLCMEPNPR